MLGESVYIFDALRTPRAKSRRNGKLISVKPINLLTTVLREIRDRHQLDTSLINDVNIGCVTQSAEQGGCLAKAATQYAGYHQSVPAATHNRFCGSGLSTINQVAAQIAAGQMDLCLAGGVESMSRTPMGSDGGAWSLDPDVAFTTSFIPQGVSADLIATLDGKSREDLDQWAVLSHQRAAAAWDEQYFQNSVVPVRDQNHLIILHKDDNIRPETNLDSLAKLPPAFAEMGKNFGYDSVAIDRYPQLENIEHFHHAGNSSALVDGAALVLLGNQAMGERLAISPKAKIVATALTSTDPTIMLTGPISATESVLAKAELELKDIDLFEINEAFASVVLHFKDHFNISEDRINVNGGAIAMGHPLGATGAILLGTMVDELERRQAKRGLITLCIGGGMGIATIIERVSSND